MTCQLLIYSGFEKYFFSIQMQIQIQYKYNIITNIFGISINQHDYAIILNMLYNYIEINEKIKENVTLHCVCLSL